MRVVTSFGFGEAKNPERDPTLVTLDTPFFGQKKMEIGKRQLFLFSDWAVLRVIYIEGGGSFANLQFCHCPGCAAAVLGLPAPPGETIFFLDLKRGTFRVNHQLDTLVSQSLIMEVWVDRWARNPTETFVQISAARSAFERKKEGAAQTAQGIKSFLHWDTESGGSILGFCLIVPPPNGVIFEREFELKL